MGFVVNTPADYNAVIDYLSNVATALDDAQGGDRAGADATLAETQAFVDMQTAAGATGVQSDVNFYTNAVQDYFEGTPNYSAQSALAASSLQGALQILFAEINDFKNQYAAIGVTAGPPSPPPPPPPSASFGPGQIVPPPPPGPAPAPGPVAPITTPSPAPAPPTPAPSPSPAPVGTIPPPQTITPGPTATGSGPVITNPISVPPPTAPPTSPFDITGVEAWITTVIPELGRSLWNWIVVNIIQPLEAFFIWLFNIWLGILGWEYDTVKKIVTYPLSVKTPLPTTLAETVAYESEVSQIIDHPTNVWQFTASLFIRVALGFSAIGARLEPLLAVITQVANAQQPTTLLSAGDAIDGVYKGTITVAYASDNLLKQGVSGADFNVLYNNASYTPSAQEAGVWLARGYIDAAQFTVLAAASHASDLIAGFQRAASFKIADGMSLASIQGRLSAAQAGFMTASLNNPPPGDVTALYLQNQGSVQQAAIDWTQHFSIPDPAWFAQAVNRGLVPPQWVQQAAIANNYPPEIAGLFTAMAQALIPTRTIATLVADKTISVEQATAYYLKAGFAPADIPVLIAYAETLVKKAPKGPPGDLARLALSDAVALYNDGAIPAAELITIYEAHGWTADAAALAIEYLNLKQKTTARTAYANELVDQVKLGEITAQQAVSTLYQNGYTTAEVVKYQKAMGKGPKAKVTVPTTAEIAAMYKAGYIDQDAVVNYYVGQGYVDPYLTGLILTVLNKTAATPVTSIPLPAPPTPPAPIAPLPPPKEILV